MNNPAHRIFHYIIARLINGKIDSEAIVGAFDCLQMWSMIAHKPLNVGIIATSCIKRQGEKGRKGIYVGAWITRILKNMNLFPDRAPHDRVGKSLPMLEHVLRYWGFAPAKADNPMPQQTAIPSTERRGLLDSLAQMRQDLDDFRREQ